MTIDTVIILLFKKESSEGLNNLAIVTQPASQHKDSITGSQSPEPMLWNLPGTPAPLVPTSRGTVSGGAFNEPLTSCFLILLQAP